MALPSDEKAVPPVNPGLPVEKTAPEAQRSADPGLAVAASAFASALLSEVRTWPQALRKAAGPALLGLGAAWKKSVVQIHRLKDVIASRARAEGAQSSLTVKARSPHPSTPEGQVPLRSRRVL